MKKLTFSQTVTFLLVIAMLVIVGMVSGAQDYLAVLDSTENHVVPRWLTRFRIAIHRRWLTFTACFVMWLFPRRYGWGRRANLFPITCHGCNWTGRQKHATHGYRSVSHDDCEPVDACPRCGSEFE
jgi:hypothetical protein